MKYLLFVIFAGCAVKCDDGNNYYVIQMPDDPPRATRKPFNVYWNVPTFQCTHKKVPFEDLYEKFGIIQNENDSFRGDKVAILYDPGNFPALLKNESTGKYFFRNGGVPQEGDLDKHLERFRNITEQSVPDPYFSGVGIIDFESWRPVFRQNFGTLVPYKDVSYEIERKRHWLWPNSWIVSEARKRFEESARHFMQNTLAEAKRLRPNAIWGYYGFPYCFNMASNNMAERCADQVPEENDQMYWLWSESTALFPSVYSSRDFSTSQLLQMVRGRVKEAARVGLHRKPILPYFWFRYRDTGFMTETDLNAVLKTLYKSNATGIVIWGSSRDVDTTDKCVKLLNYIDNVMGPAIAKYTKNQLHDEVLNDNDDFTNDTSNKDNDYNTTTTTSTTNPIVDEIIDNVTTKPNIDISTTTTNMPLKNIEPDLADPEFDWVPPENYTQDIVKYVEEQMKNKNNETDIANENNINRRGLTNSNNVLMEFIKTLFNIDRNESNSNILGNEARNFSKDKVKNLDKFTEEELTSTIIYNQTSIEITERYDLETDTYLGAYASLSISRKNDKKETSKSITSSTTTDDLKEIDNSTISIENYTESTTATTESYTEVTTKTMAENNQFYNQHTLFDHYEGKTKSGTESTESTTVIEIENDDITRELTTEQIYLNLPNDTTTERDLNFNEISISTEYMDLTITLKESYDKDEQNEYLDSTNKIEVKETVTSNAESISTNSAADQVVIHVI